MEDFVTYELAVKLKEKGFIGNGDIGCRCGIYTDSENYVYDDLDNSELLYGECLRFTISQVLKWLRDEKNTHIEIYTNASGYNYIISDTPKLGGSDRYWSDHEGPNDGGCWDSYEEAVIAGINYIIDNLI